ncbi:MAG: GDP-mannose 4,6-dehydratase [Candidatus Woesearchaeota archaeon]
MKKALITGITGQDGSYLAELLLNKEYEVHGIVRRAAIEDSNHRLSRIKHIEDSIELHPGSLEAYPTIFNIFQEVKPDECYHLASQSFVFESFKDPFTTFNTNIYGTLHVLEALKRVTPNCRFYFAGTSEMFGNIKESPQNEKTPFHPRSPYGISKNTGFDLTRNYREGHNIFGASGILFNHESPRRGLEFVTRKITDGVAKIKHGLESELRLGNLDAKRDWGFAKDYVEAMWMMLQAEEPSDYVVSSGRSHSIRDFLDIAFNHVGLEFRDYVKVDPKFLRPAEVHTLQGDSSKIKTELGWEPKTEFGDLIKMMVDHDMERVKKEL